MSIEIRIEEQLRLARSMVSSGNRWGAKEILKALLVAQPDHIAARLELSEMLLSDGQLEQALLQASFAYGLNPNYPGLARHTGDLYFLLGLYPKAKECLLAAIKHGDSDNRTEERLVLCQELTSASDKDEQFGH